jgi:hypothetical protein
MLKTVRTIATLAAAGALLAVPGTALAAPGGQGQVHGQGHAKSCQKTPKLGYQVSGALVSVTEDDTATTGVNEATVTLTVTVANSAARKSGEIADQDATTDGVQVKGATYTVPASDAFVLNKHGYVDPDTPSAGDFVKVSGRIALTKKRCAPEGTSTADRLDTPDVRRVTIFDRDADV